MKKIPYALAFLVLAGCGGGGGHHDTTTVASTLVGTYNGTFSESSPTAGALTGTISMTVKSDGSITGTAQSSQYANAGTIVSGSKIANDGTITLNFTYPNDGTTEKSTLSGTLTITTGTTTDAGTPHELKGSLGTTVSGGTVVFATTLDQIVG